jgi:hypothetical protein
MNRFVLHLLVGGLLAVLPSSALTQPPDWIHDVLVAAHPAAAVGGAQAGIYTAAVNGVRPWRAALLRWLTGRHVMGNTAVLVRQEGPEGGACLAAVLDPQADYVLEVSAFVPGGREFGEAQAGHVELEIAVLAEGDAVVARGPVDSAAGVWKSSRLAFHNESSRRVQVVVRARSPRHLPCVYFVEDFRLSRADRWWSPQNLFDEPRTVVGLADRRPRMCQMLDPDMVSGHNGPYLNWDGFFSRRGIAVGGGFWEQEYNHLAADDPGVPRFLDDGVARELDGRPIAKGSLWPGYHMCHNAPAWHLYQQQRLARIAPEVQSITQDNICAPSFEQAGSGCFCHACRDGFRQWLRARWTAEQFRAAGIDRPDQFDVTRYAAAAAPQRIKQGRDAVLADPVLRAYVQFQYASQLQRWRETVAAVKHAAGHSLAVCGNQWGAGGQRPYSVALSSIGDVVAVEAGGRPHNEQNRAWDTLSAKLGQAAGEYQRPVWLYMTSLFHASEAARSRLRFTTAQAWADGAVSVPWATAPEVSGWFFDTEAHVCRFVQSERALFARRDRVANVGLVYSLPTHAWRTFRAWKLSPEPMRSWFAAWARLLEEAHVPYEVNCWSHPLLGSDRAALERLSRDRVVVLPGVDCFTDEQRAALRAFQSRGGRVISVRSDKYFDGDAVPRPAGETLAAPGAKLAEIDPALMLRYSRASAKSTPEAAAEVRTVGEQLTATLRRSLGDDMLLTTDAPAAVWANLWLDETRQVLALHLVNGDIDLAADRLRPVANSRWRVRLPEGLRVDQAVVLSPDEAGETSPPRPLHVEVAGRWATVVVPRVESYTIVALAQGQALAEANRKAAARRTQWQAALRASAPKPEPPKIDTCQGATP